MATFFVGADAPSFHTFNQVWVDGYGWCTCLPAPYQPLQQQEAMNTWVGGYPAAHLYPVRQLTSSLFVFASSEMTRFNTFYRDNYFSGFTIRMCRCFSNKWSKPGSPRNLCKFEKTYSHEQSEIDIQNGQTCSL